MKYYRLSNHLSKKDLRSKSVTIYNLLKKIVKQHTNVIHVFNLIKVIDMLKVINIAPKAIPAKEDTLKIPPLYCVSN